MLGLDKKFYLSIGGVTNIEIIDFISRYKLSNSNTVILFGFQAEPTPIESNNLLRIDSLKKLTNLDIGFMDHSKAGDLYDTSLSVLALGMGVRIFEKHITLDRELKIEDYISALTPGEFYRYTQTIKNLPRALGSGNLDLNDNELVYRNKVLKKVVATKNLAKGDIITLSDIKLSRPEKPGGHFKLEEIVHKKLTKNILSGNFISIEDVS
jgi:sialic acid synthase SpsE